jgi:hypothetical protein
LGGGGGEREGEREGETETERDRERERERKRARESERVGERASNRFKRVNVRVKIPGDAWASLGLDQLVDDEVHGGTGMK